MEIYYIWPPRETRNSTTPSSKTTKTERRMLDIDEVQEALRQNGYVVIKEDRLLAREVADRVPAFSLPKSADLQAYANSLRDRAAVSVLHEMAHQEGAVKVTVQQGAGMFPDLVVLASCVVVRQDE